MLDVFITSRVRRKIVVVYAKYPDFHTHVRGLAKLIKEDPGNIQRELKRLEKVGFLTSDKQGNTKIYSICAAVFTGCVILLPTPACEQPFHP